MHGYHIVVGHIVVGLFVFSMFVLLCWSDGCRPAADLITKYLAPIGATPSHFCLRFLSRTLSAGIKSNSQFQQDSRGISASRLVIFLFSVSCPSSISSREHQRQSALESRSPYPSKRLLALFSGDEPRGERCRHFYRRANSRRLVWKRPEDQSLPFEHYRRATIPCVWVLANACGSSAGACDKQTLVQWHDERKEKRTKIGGRGVRDHIE